MAKRNDQQPAHDGSTLREVHRTKTTRSRSGCLICRARKVKCDESLPTCRNCERLGQRCPGYTQKQQQHSSFQSSSPRHVSSTNNQISSRGRRIYAACNACRSSKVRCSGGDRQCTRCREKHLICIYPSSQRPQWTQNQSLTNFSSRTEDGGSTLGIREYVLEDGIEHSSVTSRPSHPNKDVQSLSTHETGQVPVAEMSPSWLYSKYLPTKERILELTEEYFSNVHHLRSFGFVHKPSFMQSLDEEPTSKFITSPLLHVMCALGAKFYALKYESAFNLPFEKTLAAGDQWAEEARRLIFHDLNTVSVENLMASVLLHDHEIRVGRYTSCFLISAHCVRLAHLLQLNLEFSPDLLCRDSNSPSASSRESRRRLMWSIYIIDSWVGSGIDRLTLLNDSDMEIQLPCPERSFIFQTPEITDSLQPGDALSELTKEQRSLGPKESMSMTAFFIRVVSLRKKVLRYKKVLDSSQPPWELDSAFSKLVTALEDWKSSLPSNMKFAPTSIYAWKDSSQLGELCLLHCAYHQTLVNLYQISMPQLSRSRPGLTFPLDQQDFVRNSQDKCFFHAKEGMKVMQATARHGIKYLSDTWLVVVLYESIRVMLYYRNMFSDRQSDHFQVTTDEVVEYSQFTLSALKAMRSMYSTAAPCEGKHTAAKRMIITAGLEESTVNQDAMENGDNVPDPLLEDTPISQETAAKSPESVMHPLAIFRLAREGVPENQENMANRQQMSSTHASPIVYEEIPQEPLYSIGQVEGPLNAAKNILDLSTTIPSMTESSSTPARSGLYSDINFIGDQPSLAFGWDDFWDQVDVGAEFDSFSMLPENSYWGE